MADEADFWSQEIRKSNLEDLHYQSEHFRSWAIYVRHNAQELRNRSEMNRFYSQREIEYFLWIKGEFKAGPGDMLPPGE
jgi:hypothetical protein